MLIAAKGPRPPAEAPKTREPRGIGSALRGLDRIGLPLAPQSKNPSDLDRVRQRRIADSVRGADGDDVWATARNAGDRPRPLAAGDCSGQRAPITRRAASERRSIGAVRDKHLNAGRRAAKGP